MAHNTQHIEPPKASWNIKTSIYLLNNLCADINGFSYDYLNAVQFEGISLWADETKKVLTLTVLDYDIIEEFYQHLNYHKRLYKLLGLHFETLLLKLDHDGQCYLIESVELNCKKDEMGQFLSKELRGQSELGLRLRRAINIALQGHIALLRVKNEEEASGLRELWQGGRMEKLSERYGIVPFDDNDANVIKFWQPNLDQSHPPIAIWVD